MQANSFSRPNQQQVMNYNTFDFAKTAVIKPPFEDFKNREVKNKQTRFVIDSRDRDDSLFPEPNSYEIKLDEDIEDVTSAEIILADIPFSSYIVNNNNNTLHVKIGTTTHAVSVEVGDYTPSELAAAFTLSLNSTITTGTFNVVYVSIKDNFTISSSVDFTLELSDSTMSKGSYANKSIGKVLGFRPETVPSVVGAAEPTTMHTYFARATFRKDFNTNKYIILHIDQMNVNHSTNTVTNKSLALVQKQYTTLNLFSPLMIKKNFNPPIGRLTKLKLLFKDYYGNLYDFQNQDHRIEIMFESNKHLRKYQDFV